MNFSWAENYPEVYKICTLFGLKQLETPKKYFYKPLNNYVQEGPQCGLVALAMALNKCDKEFISTLLAKAIQRGFTVNGEMFSAQNLADLAQDYLPASAVQLHSGYLNCDEIKQVTLNGKLLLVPYDTDKDNSPCLENGRKAHWAVISGAIETDDFFVVCRHGKARNVAIWTLEQLAKSNSQLWEVAPSKQLPTALYKIPDNGIGGDEGLREKAFNFYDF